MTPLPDTFLAELLAVRGDYERLAAPVAALFHRYVGLEHTFNNLIPEPEREESWRSCGAERLQNELIDFLAEQGAQMGLDVD